MMKLIIEKDYDSMSKKAADILIEAINDNPNIVLGLATGSTPIGMYKEIIKQYNNKKVDLSKVKSFNLDEYVGLEGTDQNSYRYFMDETFFDHININKKNTYVPDGKAEDLDAHGREYDETIEKMGGIDIQILGIGTKGHIGFNEPDSELSVGTSVVKLAENTIMDNARFFKSLDEVPKTAITMGMGSILKAKKIILLASGESKKEIIKTILEKNTLTTYIPATFLAMHPDVTVMIDEAAYEG